MKKLIFLLLLCPFFLFAQEETSKMFVGVFAAPQLNGITRPVDFPGHNVLELGFSTGINFGMRLSEKTSLRTGLGYSHIRYQYHQEIQNWNNLPPTLSEYVIRLRYHDIHVPVILQYGRKFFGTIGTEFSYQFGSENTERFINEGNGDVTMLNRLPAEGTINVAIQLGMGYSFDLNDQMQLLLEPVLKYYLKSYIIENSNLNCIGVKATLTYEL